MEDFLYESENVRIALYRHPGEHELWIKYLGRKEEDWDRFILQRGVLEDMASDAEQSYNKLRDRLSVFNNLILVSAKANGIALEDLAKAFIGAYEKEETEFSRDIDRGKFQS